MPDAGTVYSVPSSTLQRMGWNSVNCPTGADAVPGYSGPYRRRDTTASASPATHTNPPRQIHGVWSIMKLSAG